MTLWVPSRRRLLLAGAAAGGLNGILAHAQAPAVVTGARPGFPSGVQSGDVLADRGIVWTRCDRPARMWVEWSTSPSFANARGCAARMRSRRPTSPARIDLTGLPAGQDIFYRVTLGRPRRRRLERADGGPLPHRAAAPAAGALRLVGRHRRPGLGHQPRLRRHEDLRGDARSCSPTSSSTAATPSTPTARSCPRSSWPTAASGATSSPRRRARSPRRWTSSAAATATTCSTSNVRALQRRGAADLAVGRPRGHQQLVGRQGPVAPTRATPRRTCRCWSRAARARSSSTRRCAGTRSEEEERVYRQHPLRAAARRVRARHAQLPRPQHAQPAGAGRRRHRRSSAPQQLEWLKRRADEQRARPGR